MNSMSLGLTLAENYSSIELGLAAYTLVISISGFIIMGIDKGKAKSKERRVSEGTLMTISFLGGAIGVLIGMLIFKHKTNKNRFRLGIPLLYIINQIIGILIVLYIK